MPIEQEQQSQSANSPANIIILIGKDNNRKQLETRIEQAKEAIRKATGQGMEVKFDKIHILGDGIKTIQEVVKEKKDLIESSKFTGDNTALFLWAHGGHNGQKNEGRFGGFIDNRQSLQGFLKAHPYLTKFPIKTGFCYDGSMFKTATQKELEELEELGKLEDIDIDNIEELEELELLEELEVLKIERLEELTDKIKINRDNSIIKDATISTSTNSKFEELASDNIENIGQYIENIYSNPKSPLQQLIAEDLASPSSRYILHNNKITKLSRFLKGLNVDSPEVKDNDLKGLAEKFIINRKAELIEAYPDQKDFIETLGKEEELNVLTDKILNKALILFAHRGTTSAVEILLSKEEEIDINRQNQDSFTALHLACAKGHQEIVETLLASEKINLNLQTNDGVTALYLACYKGRQEIVETLLANEKMNLNLQTNDGWTALYLACYKGRQEIVETLLANEKIDPNIQNKDGVTALHIACENGDQEIVRMLLANKKIDQNILDQGGWTALHIACEDGDQEIVKMLLANEKIDPNIQNKDGVTALHIAYQNDHQEIVKMLLANKKIDPNILDQGDWTALHIACENGDQEIVKMLLEKGAKINLKNHQGETALDIAYQNNHQEIVKMLLANEKIDPNIPDQYGWTALHIACKEGYQEIVETLLEKGADINSKNHQGETALYLACRNGRIEVMKTLLKNEKINPNILDENGNTALHFACAKGHQEVLRMLLGKRADINLTNKEGKTALDVAREKNHQEIVNYLVSQGALTGEELSQKRSSKSSEAKDGATPSKNPETTGSAEKVATEEKAQSHQ